MSTRPSDIAGVIAAVDPAIIGATTTDSEWGDMTQFDQAMCIYMVGTTNGTNDVQIRQATDSSGTSAKNITGKSITQLSGSDDNKQAIINIEASDLDATNGFTHISMRIVTGGATNVLSGLILGFRRSPGPASDGDITSVAEIV